MVRVIPVFVSLFLMGVFVTVFPFSYSEGAETEVMSRVLGSMPLFEGLSEKGIQDIEKIAELKEYPANTTLIRKGQRLDRLYLIISGRGEVRLKDQNIPFGRDYLLGEVEFVDPLPAVAEVFMITGCRLVEIQYAALDRLLRSRPEMGLIVMRNLARALSRKIQGMNQ
jgi:CRP/FNR family cyclic AMP-dependent transcriptional regulator